METRSKTEAPIVGIGSAVRVKLSDDTAIVVTIVLPHEVDPAQGKISYQSPLGRALLGKQGGDHIIYSVGDRAFQADILEIYPKDE